eukprot:scaffold23542_cov242-Isochrysis_galbana.AAC.2
MQRADAACSSQRRLLGAAARSEASPHQLRQERLVLLDQAPTDPREEATQRTVHSRTVARRSTRARAPRCPPPARQRQKPHTAALHQRRPAAQADQHRRRCPCCCAVRRRAARKKVEPGCMCGAVNRQPP